MRCTWACLLIGASLVGCAGVGASGASSSYDASRESYDGEGAVAPVAPGYPSPAPSGGPQYAERPPAAPPVSEEAGSPTATDAVDISGQLLIYTANLGMSVYRVDEVRTGVIEAIRALGGVMTLETATQVTMRVPAQRFTEALEQVEALGDVVSRYVQAQDVGEEFRDLSIRIETLEAMRARVARLLEQAPNVEAALAVEQHLERITLDLERLKGRQRYLANQVSFSTITVTFAERQVEDIARGPFELPIDWLRQIGLTNLMRLR